MGLLCLDHPIGNVVVVLNCFPPANTERINDMSAGDASVSQWNEAVTPMGKLPSNKSHTAARV